MTPQRILVIKHGAFGDFVQAMGAFESIRSHHPHDGITLLTCAPYHNIAADVPWFDDVFEDKKPKFWDIQGIKDLRSWFLYQQFHRVYDLQNSDRTAFYFWMLWPHRPNEWSGAVAGCRYHHNTPHRKTMHTIERLNEQLALAGLTHFYPPRVDWALSSDVVCPQTPFALLVPGGSAHRPEKRWPVSYYTDIASYLVGQGITPLLIGTHIDAPLNDHIKQAVPECIDMTGKTQFRDLATLGSQATVAIGNDTGPLHLLSIAGTPTVALFSHASDPVRCAQRGPWVKIFREKNLADIFPHLIIESIESFIKKELPR
jgi:ADP-heptose:LPS heptosyltransferase